MWPRCVVWGKSQFEHIVYMVIDILLLPEAGGFFFLGFLIQCVNARECDFFVLPLLLLFYFRSFTVLFFFSVCCRILFCLFVCCLKSVYRWSFGSWLYFFVCKYDEYKAAKVILRVFDLKHLCIMSVKKGWRYSVWWCWYCCFAQFRYFFCCCCCCFVRSHSHLSVVSLFPGCINALQRLSLYFALCFRKWLRTLVVHKIICFYSIWWWNSSINVHIGHGNVVVVRVIHTNTIVMVDWNESSPEKNTRQHRLSGVANGKEIEWKKHTKFFTQW